MKWQMSLPPLNALNLSEHSLFVTTLMVPSLRRSEVGPLNLTAPHPATTTAELTNWNDCSERNSSQTWPHPVVIERLRGGGQTDRPDALAESEVSRQSDDGDIVVLVPPVVLLVCGHLADLHCLRAGRVVVLPDVVLPQSDDLQLVVDAVGGSDDVPGGDEAAPALVLQLPPLLSVAEGGNPGVRVEPGHDPAHHPGLEDGAAPRYPDLPGLPHSTVLRQTEQTGLAPALPALLLLSPAVSASSTRRGGVTSPPPALGAAATTDRAGGPTLPGTPTSGYDWEAERSEDRVREC